MSRYVCSDAERYAVYMTHGEKCYLCRKPIDYKSMEVDHIIPQSLLDDVSKLAETLRLLNRPADFDLNSFANWMPACRPYNGEKSARIFEPAPIVLIELQAAAEKAPRAAAHARATLTSQEISKALSVLERADERGQLTAEQREALEPLLRDMSRRREPEQQREPLRLLPGYEVLSDDGVTKIIRGPYGVGARPSRPDADASFDCPTCGRIAAWSGARCVFCGHLSDD